MPDRSNADFFEALKHLIDAWCDLRSLHPLSRILGPYLGFNGLTDGWGELGTSLKSIRALDRDQLTSVELAAVEDLIRMADDAVHRRSAPSNS
jgi:hypothetical protein